MSTATTYGGWVSGQYDATGVTSSLVRWVGWAAAGAALASIGTGGELSFDHLRQGAEYALHASPVFEVTEVEKSRSPSENIARIKEVLNPAISDLAITFGVSRQSIYNWINGEHVAEENAAKLKDLAQAADVLTHEGIKINAAILKRKFANGRTLMQVAQAGESARDAALLLAQIHKREAVQRDRMNARLASRTKTPATADFDLPASSDPV